MNEKKRHWWLVKFEASVVADNPTEALEEGRKRVQDMTLCDSCVKLLIEK